MSDELKLVDWFVFEVATGRIRRCGQSSDPNNVVLQAREGERAVIGKADPRRQKVVNGELVEYRPDPPTPEHTEWNETLWRWQLPSDVRNREAARKGLLRDIAALEAKQPRAQREWILAADGSEAEAAAAERLRAIEDEIAKLRAELAALSAASH